MTPPDGPSAVGPPPEPLESFDPERARPARLTAIVLAGAMFMSGLDSTILVTALPQMAREFGVNATSLSSAITVYVLVAATMMPISSWLGEYFGSRRVFMTAIVGFTLSSIACGLAPSLPLFIAGRAVQALFAGMMVPVGSLVLLRVTPKFALISVMAIATTPALIAPVVGPPLGGFITSFLDWRWAFFINGPIGMAGVLAAHRFIPRIGAEQRVPFDFVSFVLTSGALCSMLIGFDRLAHVDANHSIAGVILATGIVLGCFAYRHNKRAPHPLIPLAALRHPTFVAATVTAGNLVRIPFGAQAFVIPMMFQIGFGLSAFHAGLLVLAQNAGDLILKPIAGKALRRLGFRRALLSGALTMAASLTVVAMLTARIPFPALFAILFVVGMCRSILFTSLAAARFAEVTDAEMGGANVLANLGLQTMAAIGISFSALLLNAFSGGEQTPDMMAFRVTMLILAGMCALAAPLFARLPEDAGSEVTLRRRSPQSPGGSEL